MTPTPPTASAEKAMPALDRAQIIPYSAIRYVNGYTEDYVKEYARTYAEAQLAELRAENEKNERRLVWAMDHMGRGATGREFCSHVLRRGGNGDFGDCATFIDAILAADGKEGAHG